jgi:hypothetical protein
MPRAIPARGYWAGVECIALNDEPGERDPNALIGYASVHVLSAAFGLPTRTVAIDVVRLRGRYNKEEA